MTKSKKQNEQQTKNKKPKKKPDWPTLWKSNLFLDT